MTIKSLEKTIPQLKELCQMEDVFWINPNKETVAEANTKVKYSMKDIHDASDRLERFAPFIKATFEDTVEKDGIIESFITEIPEFKSYL